jgi:hypothetical protein
MTATAERWLKLGVLALALAVFSYTQADPDLWGHVLFGRDTAVSGAVARLDPYSFASDRPWINHEWLAEVATYEAWIHGGSLGLVTLKILLLLLMLRAIVANLPAGIAPEALAFVVGVVVLGTLPQAVHVRPQLFSLTLFAVLLRTLAAGWGSPPRDRVRDALFVTAIIALWTNLHGGWIVGAGTLGLWVALSVVQDRPWRQRVWMMLAGVAAILGSLLNPYGWRLWTFLFSTVGFGREGITDWQPVYRMAPAFVVLWLALATVMLFALRRAVRQGAADARILTVVFLFGIAAFRVNRLIAFFAISIAVLLGRWLAELVAGTPRAERLEPRPRRNLTLAATALGIALALVAAGIVAQNASCVRVNPLQIPDAQSTHALAASSLRGRLLTTFDWGQYAIWFLSPRLQVSLDGRRETVYSDRVVDEQFRLFDDPAAHPSVLDELSPDYAWLPADARLVPFLESRGWTRLVAGERAIVLGREPEPPLATPVAAAIARCFPGP